MKPYSELFLFSFRKIFTLRKVIFLLALTVFTVSAFPAHGAKKKKKKPVPGIMIPPPGYKKNRKYPVVVALPYTGGTGRNLLEYYLFSEYNPRRSLTRKWANTLKKRHRNWKTRKRWSYFIYIPWGKGSTRDHSEKGFARAIWRYEKRIFDGMRYYARKYPINKKRVYLAGHSLGGDLAWALSLRKPHRYAGALISGSRTSYWEDKKLRRLRRKGYRFFFSMGELEKAIRLRGLRFSLAKLKKVKNRFFFYRPPGLAHVPPDKLDLFHALEYVVFGKTKYLKTMQKKERAWKKRMKIRIAKRKAKRALEKKRALAEKTPLKSE